MPKTILLISDVHANYPALKAVGKQIRDIKFDLIINGGDMTVYAPFPNETIDWLRNHNAVSILGNTDIKVLRIIDGKKMKKPRNAEKRIMYTWTAENLTTENKEYLIKTDKRAHLELEGHRIGIFHGSPASDNEHLFSDTPTSRFHELAKITDCDIVLIGHSHSPFHKKVNNVHFINPGSVGRMFDKNPDASYAIMELSPEKVNVDFYRCPYDIEKVVTGLRNNLLPSIYEEMYRSGTKLN